MARKYTPLSPARLTYSGGAPYSDTYGDVYHSADGGLGQARHVFLAGNDLPERWRGRETLAILETGFGLGLNFLATWAAWRADPKRPARLNFVSVEKHPFRAADLARLHSRWPELASLSGELVTAWPPLIAGFHRLHFDDGGITLTLLLGDAADLLPQLAARIDVFFLDGFAPDRNPDLWSPAIASELARLAAPGATAATYTVAAMAREMIEAAGFVACRRPGFGHKRQMLVGHRPGAAGAAPRYRRAAIIGAGLAGTFCAERLAARGWDVALIERHSGPAREASGNPSGVLYPILHLAETANARLSRTAFLYALRHLRSLHSWCNLHGPNLPGHDVHNWPTGASNLAGGTGLLHLPATADNAAKLKRILDARKFPDDFVRAVDADEAAQLANYPVRGGGCWFPHGAWVYPPGLCAANIERAGGRITRRFDHQALGLTRLENDWRIMTLDGGVIVDAPVVIIAAAIDSLLLAEARHLPLHPVRGQITCLPPLPEKTLDISITGDGYVSPMPGGGYCVGATFQHDDFDDTPRAADHAENLQRLDALLPGFAAGVDPETLDGRVSYRATTPDRLPIFGELREGLHVATGLGARGLLWAPLGAELLAGQLNGEPLPAENDLIAAIDPGRFQR